MADLLLAELAVEALEAHIADVGQERLQALALSKGHRRDAGSLLGSGSDRP